MNINNIIKFKISLIILLQIFYKISSTASMNYPYSITLANGNIFLIQKTGIDIYDKSLNKISQIIEFSGEEEITEDNFSKIVIKYNNEYILSIINDKIFIFNNEGKLLYKSKEKINDDQIIYSYSLTFINATNKTCDYIIGYFDENSYLNLYLYRYNIEINNITLLSEYKNNNIKYENNDYNIPGIFKFTDNQKLLSCEYMLTYSIFMLPKYTNLLVCFFNSNTTVGIVVYNIVDYFDNFDIIQYQGLFKNSLFISTKNIENSKNIASIQSELNNNRNLSIIWWNFKGNNQIRYFIYDLSYMIHLYKTSSLYNKNIEDLYSWEVPNTCISREYEVRFNIFPYKDQTAFSCRIEDENIQILLYNKTNLMNDSYIINNSCENNNKLSKLYLNDDKNYLIYPCFKNCSNKKFENDSDCLNKRENEDNKRSEEENDNENKKRYMIMIIIIIAIIITLFIAFIIIIIIKYFKNNKFERKWQKGKEDEKLIKNIIDDLLPK